MQIMFDGYKIETDDRQFIVSQEKVVQAGRFTKEENVGKKVWEEIGYCGSIDSAVNLIAKKEVLMNNDIKVIKEKLDAIRDIVKGLAKILTVKVGK